MANISEIVDKVEAATGCLMEYESKVERAVNGAVTGKGFVGGVGEDATPERVLAKYDELGGYITRRGIKAKNGQYHDAKTKQPVTPEQHILVVQVNGSLIEQVDGGEEPLEVKIALNKARSVKSKKKSRKDEVEE